MSPPMIGRIQKVSAGIAAGLVAMAGALPAIAQVKALQVDFKSPQAGAEIRGTAIVKAEARSSAEGVEAGGIISEFTVRIQGNGGREAEPCRPEESAHLCRTVSYRNGPGPTRASAIETLEVEWRTKDVSPVNGVYDVVTVVKSDLPGVEKSEKVLQDLKVNNPPERPRNVDVSTPVRGEPKLGVTWAKNPEPDIIRYEVSRAEGDQGFSDTKVVGAGSSSYQDPSVPFDTPVRYQVVAFRASPVTPGGIASPPATTSAVTVQSPPPPPSPTPSSTPGGVKASPKAGGSQLKDLSGKLGTPNTGSKVVKPVSLAAPNSISGPRRDGGSGFGRLLPFGKDAPQSLFDEEFAEAVGDAIRNPGTLISEELEVNPVRFIAAAFLLLVTAGHLGRGAQSLFRSAKSATASSSPAVPV